MQPIGPKDGVGGYDERPVVALLPPRSSHIAAVRQAALAVGARFVTLDPAHPSEMDGKLLVIDMTATRGVAHLGRSVVAIADRMDLDCYAVIRSGDVPQVIERVLRNLVERAALIDKVQVERETVRSLNEIGYALSAHASREALLETILTAARRALCADSGSIYLLTDDQRLAFVCAQNDTVPFQAQQVVLPLDETSIAGYVALRGEVLNIPDTYSLPPDSVYQVNRSFDDAHGYQTHSMLDVPMRDRDGRVIGVLALMNRKPHAGVAIRDWDEAIGFTQSHAEVALSIGSQAAVIIDNFRLYQEIRTLFDGFVDAAVNAIEARDPTTGGHSSRVASLTTELAQAVDTTSDGPFAGLRFGPADLTELRYASLLHDFGKVGVSEKVLLKTDRLYPWELDQVVSRFRVAGLQMLVELTETGGDADEIRPALDALERDLARVRELNQPRNTIRDRERAEIEAIARKWRLADVGEPVLMSEQVNRLCIPYGTLDPEERAEIESHVTHTYNFLKLIPWTRELKRVPELAFAHHEKMDGTGYPRGLTSDAIPVGSKLMTISDIFDALTAADRPYKTKMSVERALSILREQAERGHVWGPAVELFAARRVWEGICV